MKKKIEIRENKNSRLMEFIRISSFFGGLFLLIMFIGLLLEDYSFIFVNIGRFLLNNYLLLAIASITLLLISFNLWKAQ